MKIDPWKHKEKYLEWKESVRDGIPNMSKENSEIILRYLNDMERGINIAKGTVKGSRSYLRLSTLKEKMLFFSKKFKILYNLDKITDISEDQIISLFSDMRNGIIKKSDGGTYKSLETYGKVFKAFWHWYQKTSKKQGIEILDITSDLDARQEKPDWVYLTEDEIKKLCDSAKFEYKVLIMFLFDTGIRAPTELVNIRVSDFFDDFKELLIREEISKTFGRRIKLMFCTNIIKEYIQVKNLKENDYLFHMFPPCTNQYLKRLAKRVLGDKVSPAGQKYSQLTMYDFRHNSCCYWLNRYKSEIGIKYRFGWKKSDKLHYYSEFLGMRDTINEDDMLVDITKTEIEKKLDKSDKEKQLMREEIDSLKMQMNILMEEWRQLKHGTVQIVEFTK